MNNTWIVICFLNEWKLARQSVSWNGWFVCLTYSWRSTTGCSLTVVPLQSWHRGGCGWSIVFSDGQKIAVLLLLAIAFKAQCRLWSTLVVRHLQRCRWGEMIFRRSRKWEMIDAFQKKSRKPQARRCYSHPTLADMCYVHIYSTFYKLICLSARSWCFNLVIRFKKSYIESIGKAFHTNNSLLSLISITGLMFYITYFNNWLLYSPKIINWIQHLSQFGDIYLEEYFIKYLKSGIQVWVFDMKKYYQFYWETELFTL